MPRVKINGVIIPNDYQDIYDWLGWDATSPKKVEQQLSDIEGDIVVEINSGGGSVFAGSEIYTMLRDHAGQVTVKITGVAASAASVIAMAGDKVLMSPTAQIMIHNATISAQGDYREMEHTSDFLKNVNQTIANAYKAKSGIDDDKLLALMDKETWFTPQQALEHNLIDEIMFENQVQVVADFGGGLLPQEVINTIKSKIMKQEKPTNNKSDFLMAKLKYLKLKENE